MRRLISLLTTTTLITGLVALVAPTQAAAHGSMDNPASRVYMCKFVTPDDPRCEAAREANPQSLYDWMEVNIGDAAGRHRELGVRLRIRVPRSVRAGDRAARLHHQLPIDWSRSSSLIASLG